jgi:tetratricopeptide (TPR) repeat protein
MGRSTISHGLSISLVLGSLLMAPVLTETAQAQSASDGRAELPSTQAYRAATQEGRTAYNNGSYETALDHFIDAAQARPDQPSVYRNIARTYYWMKQYAPAVAYYDMYLRVAPDSAETKRITQERRSAADRTGDTVWKLPDDQKRVQEALQEQLNTGDAYTQGGGGAWALYQTLLRTGYARPDLAELKARLRTKLVDEFEARLVPQDGQPTPQLSLSEWRLQEERLQSALKLADTQSFAGRLRDRLQVVDAAVALLNGEWGRAASMAQSATKSNPDMDFVRWFHLAALVHAERYGEASAALDNLRSRVAGESSQLRDYHRLMQAIVAQRRGDTDSAASIYSDLLD